MDANIETLFVAIVVFVGAHFALAGRPLRGLLTDTLGERGYLILYSLVAVASLSWVAVAYGQASEIAFWPQYEWTRWVPNLAMPIACVLIVSGLTIVNPTAVGGERAFEDPRGAHGILTVTRHPFLWGTGLWALAHLPPNGDARGLLLFGGLAILSFAGMVAIDAKRRDRLGGRWGPFEMTTSIIPFAAIAQGRTRLDWPGIGWWRVGLGLVLWLLLSAVHVYVIGVSPLPFD